MELAEGLAPPMSRGLQPRAFATRPRQRGSGRRSRTSTLLGQSQPAYPFAHPRTWWRRVHRDQVSNLESSHSECDVLPIAPSLCTRHRRGGGQAPPPVYLDIRACMRIGARDVRARTRARAHENHLRFQLRYSGCERAGAILHRPSDRWRFPLRGKEKRPGVCQAL